MNVGNKGKRQLALAKGETRHMLKEGGNMVGRRDPNKQTGLEIVLDVIGG
jgi:hypothetical protein